jgi:rRNA maturation protein Rpf1
MKMLRRRRTRTLAKMMIRMLPAKAKMTRRMMMTTRTTPK